MEEVKCASCNKEIGDEDVFEHEGKSYCSECIVEHVKRKHVKRKHPLEPEREGPAAELEYEKAKHSPEAKRAHTYKSY